MRREPLVARALEDERKERALVSYNYLKARHSGDEVILLVGVRSYDTHQTVTLKSDMQRTPKLC